MKKIMFNDRFGLTKAVLEGRKTQTRRIVSQSAIKKAIDYQEEYFNGALEKIDLATAIHQLYFVEKILKPSYDTEVVAIAQSYKDCGYNDDYIKNTAGWTNKMFVKANLMPHRIKIERLRVERLQDISDEDCLKEGIYEDGGNDHFIPHYFYNYYNSNSDGFKTPQLAYAHLIDKINGKGTWNSNLFVLAYDYKLIK